MNDRVSFREKLAYGIGDAGCSFIWTVVGSFLTLYYTDNVGIAAGVIGTIMLLTRIFDGISDIIMGVIIDKTHTRWGKARPWILWTSPFMAVGLMLLFNVPGGLSDASKIIYISTTYIFVTVVVYTACNLSYSALLSLIATKQEDRTMLASIRFICALIASIGISYATMNVVAAIGWGKTSVIFGIIGMILLLITFFGTKEKVASADLNKNEANSVNVAASFQLLFKNKYFLFAALLFIINYASMGGAMGIGIYYARLVLKNEGIFGTLMMLTMAPALLGLFAFPALAGKFGKWKCLMAGYFMEILGYLLIFLFPTNVPVLLAGIFIKGVGNVPHMAGLFAMIADIVDYGEWKTGVRLDGLTYSAVSFGMKVGTGLGSAIVGWGLAIGHYNASLDVQPEEAIAAIKAIYSWVPLLMIVAGVLILLMCNLDKIYPQIKADLEAKKQLLN
jgi:GPH family glycoside/pentoside/hexuronide:cation symporter